VLDLNQRPKDYEATGCQNTFNDAGFESKEICINR
jgi:hypothetical protein